MIRRRWRARIVLTGALLAVAPALLLPAAQQPPPGGGADTGAIGGVVTDAATARPLAGADVVLTSAGRDRPYSSRTVTDSDGRFVFSGVPAGASYVLRSGKAGYADGSLARRDAGSGALSSLVPVTIGPGERILNANIAMWPLGSISGTVVDERGEPVVNVPVRVVLRMPVAGTLHPVAGPIDRTDDRGFYEITELSEGSYFVGPMTVGSAPPPLAGRRQVYPPVFYPFARSLDDALPVDVGPGERRTGVDFVLRPVPAAAVSGRLTGPPDAVAGRLLRLLPDGSEQLGLGSEHAATTAGPTGEFAFLNVAAGTYLLDTRSATSELTRGVTTGAPALDPTPGFVPLTGRNQPISARQGVDLVTRIPTRNDAYDGRVRLTVGSENVVGLEVPLQPLATIAGTFVCAETHATPCHVYPAAEPASGDPALAPPVPSGATAEREAALVARGLISRSEPLAAPGTFVIHGLAEGEYFIRLPDPNPSVLIKSVVVRGVDHTDRPIAVSSADIDDVVVTLTARTASISGRVRDVRGVDLIEGAVVVFPTDATLWTRFGFNPPRIRAMSFFGAAGYRLTGLPAGEYYLIAGDVSLADAWQDPRFFPAAAASAARVSLDWGEAATLHLTSREVKIR